MGHFNSRSLQTHLAHLGPDGETLDLECDAVAEWNSSDDCAWGGMSYFAYNENCV